MSTLENFSRQLGLLNQEWFIKTRISVVGVGNLGSALIGMMTKVGFREIVVYDHDTIESHNIANQLYSTRTVGQYKSDKIIETMAFDSPSWYHFISFKCKIGLRHAIQLINSDIMIVLTDNIKSRIETFLMVLEYKKYNYDFKWFIEAGTHAKTAKIYVVDLDNELEIASYFDKILERHNAPSEDLPCTERSTFFYANFVGSVIMSYFVKMSEEKEVPFETWIDLANNEVMRFEIPSHDKTYSIKEMIELYDPQGIKANMDSLSLIETSGYNCKTLVWSELWSTIQDYGPSNYITRFIYHLPEDLNRLTVYGDHTIRIKLAKNDKYKHQDGDCDRCPCSDCLTRSRCDERPCRGGTGCLHDKHGRVLYCSNIESRYLHKKFHFIWKIFKNTDINDVKKTIKGFFKEWGGLTV